MFHSTRRRSSNFSSSRNISEITSDDGYSISDDDYESRRSEASSIYSVRKRPEKKSSARQRKWRNRFITFMSFGISIACGYFTVVIVHHIHEQNKTQTGPTMAPTFESQEPSVSPSMIPISENIPTNKPTMRPTVDITLKKDEATTSAPTKSQSHFPNHVPSTVPSLFSSQDPSNYPSDRPSKQASESPSMHPSLKFSTAPSKSSKPSMHPTLTPTNIPTGQPTYLSWSERETITSLGKQGGKSVALSYNGECLAIGVPNQPINAEKEVYGIVKFYEYDSSSKEWTLVQNIKNDLNGGIAKFGHSVAISDDCNVIAVGAPDTKNSNNSWVGAVKYLTRGSDGLFREVFSVFGLKVKSTGLYVALSGDGNTVVVPEEKYSHSSLETGIVRVFRYQNEIFQQVGQTLHGEDQERYRLGTTVAISTSGNIIAVAAEDAPVSGIGNRVGVVKVYRLVDGTAWEQMGRTLTGQNVYEEFGDGLSLSGDGLIIAIGASYKNPNEVLHIGYLQVFQFIESDWVQMGDTIVGQCAKACTGMHLSLSKNGKVLVDGGENEARIFQFKDDNNWYQISGGFNFDGQYWLYEDGIGVSISGDGNVVAMGDTVNELVKIMDIEALVL